MNIPITSSAHIAKKSGKIQTAFESFILLSQCLSPFFQDHERPRPHPLPPVPALRPLAGGPIRDLPAVPAADTAQGFVRSWLNITDCILISKPDKLFAMFN